MDAHRLEVDDSNAAAESMDEDTNDHRLAPPAGEGGISAGGVEVPDARSLQPSQPTVEEQAVEEHSVGQNQPSEQEQVVEEPILPNQPMEEEQIVEGDSLGQNQPMEEEQGAIGGREEERRLDQNSGLNPPNLLTDDNREDILIVPPEVPNVNGAYAVEDGDDTDDEFGGYFNNLEEALRRRQVGVHFIRVVENEVEDDGMEQDDEMEGEEDLEDVEYDYLVSRYEQQSEMDEPENDDEDDEQVEHYDITLPGQHLYMPDEEAPTEDPAPPAPEPPSLLAPPLQEADPDAGGVRIFEEPPQLGEDVSPPLEEVVRLPVLNRAPQGMLVVPGMKVPMQIRDRRDVAVVRAARGAPQRAFVILDPQLTGPVRGVALHLLQLREVMGELHIIVRGGQRFRLRQVLSEGPGPRIAEVELLQEALVEAPLASVAPGALARHRRPSVGPVLQGASPDQAFYPDATQFRCSCPLQRLGPTMHRDRHRHSLMAKRTRCARYTSVLTTVPPWVLDHLDVHRLAQQVRKYLLVLGSERAQVPEGPAQVCEYATLNMPLRDANRRHLLQLSCYHQRLRYLLDLQEKWEELVCKQCSAVITERKHLFIMAKEGQQTAFVNARGFVHEIITVRTAYRVQYLGTRTSQYSWYPGYAWIIANCQGCHMHVGWKFVAERPLLRPRSFFGLTRNGVVPR